MQVVQVTWLQEVYFLPYRTTSTVPVCVDHWQDKIKSVALLVLYVFMFTLPFICHYSETIQTFACLMQTDYILSDINKYMHMWRVYSTMLCLPTNSELCRSRSLTHHRQVSLTLCNYYDVESRVGVSGLD